MKYENGIEISLSPDCRTISRSRRAVSVVPPIPESSRKSNRNSRPLFKKFGLIETHQAPITSISKCIKIKSIFKSSLLHTKPIQSCPPDAEPSRKSLSSLTSSNAHPRSASRNKLIKRNQNTYCRFRSELFPKANAICKKLFNQFSLSLRGSNLIN